MTLNRFNIFLSISLIYSQWIALIRLNYTRSLDQIILLHTFKHLISLWSDKLLTREEVRYIADRLKFVVIIKHFLENQTFVSQL